MRTLVIGDIHGNYKGFKQCLERSNFDYENDKLIILGDVCDGFPFVKDCFDEILKIKNFVYILGNHDEWAIGYYDGDIVEGDIYFRSWFQQGGDKTIQSYGYQIMDEAHRVILREAKLFHLEYNYDDIQVFTHGGFDPMKKLEVQNKNTFLWDRNLFQSAHHKHYHGRQNLKFGGYKDIFIGHTTTQCYSNELKPLHYCNLWALDTGGGWDGKITIMDTKTYEYWQSDLATELYPNIRGRR